ncbi:GNAT family N-acetyltransferase [Jannaschia sp. CCS1]|uniref:GNAT family N-acetyltransferase n=1 Tax=Jannaschia sp. (strain CCS1) TaxID=290400 RepID=UPI000053A7FE|nr:GNAT family protein [Jannaschia sp. CCS1]ABD56975.1 GCN5-related N-acetyltransferase [Jannaschia sp. CCS1]
MQSEAPPIVTLRPSRPADIVAHAKITPSPEIARMYGAGSGDLPSPSPDRSAAWFDWLNSHPFARIIACDDVAVGAVRLHGLNKTDCRARLAIGLFSEADLGHGIGRRAIALTLDHAFTAMALHRVDLRVLAFNTRAIRCYTACGFTHEGTERDAALIDGAFHDDWIMSILSHEHPVAD